MKVWPTNNCEKISPIDNNVCCTIPNNNIIKWNWNNQSNANIIYTLYILSLISLSLNLTDYSFILIILNLFSYFISHKIPILSESVGRIWCYIASFIPLFFLFYLKI